MTDSSLRNYDATRNDVPVSAGDEPQPRRSFLRQAATIAAAVPVAIAATSGSSEAANPNVLPTLYRGWNARNFHEILDDEIAHVDFLVEALGASARPKPIFKNLLQPTALAFANISRALENTGVGAYLGALPLLANTDFLGYAGSIALIEARHAGYLNTLLNQPITSNAVGGTSSFEVPLSPEQVVDLASPFIAGLNGGPPLIPPGGLMNPIDVLNFALALEFLEAEFYQLNVPRFLG